MWHFFVKIKKTEIGDFFVKVSTHRFMFPDVNLFGIASQSYNSQMLHENKKADKEDYMDSNVIYELVVVSVIHFIL